MNHYKINFFKLLFLLIILILIYFNFKETFHLIDTKIFLLLNKNLLSNKFGQYFFGILSHKNESWINVVLMLMINLMPMFFVKDCIATDLKKYRKKVIFLTLYCWLFFQVVLLINNIVFQKWLQVNRPSPSLVFKNCIKLSEILHNPNIKDYSNNSFPAGHALIIIYWILFVDLYAARSIKVVSWLLGFLLILPRMVTGAHWLSDTVFSLLFGWIYFNLSMWFAIYYEQIKKRIY